MLESLKNRAPEVQRELREHPKSPLVFVVVLCQLACKSPVLRQARETMGMKPTNKSGKDMFLGVPLKTIMSLLRQMHYSLLLAVLFESCTSVSILSCGSLPLVEIANILHPMKMLAVSLWREGMAEER